MPFLSCPTFEGRKYGHRNKYSVRRTTYNGHLTFWGPALRIAHILCTVQPMSSKRIPFQPGAPEPAKFHRSVTIMRRGKLSAVIVDPGTFQQFVESLDSAAIIRLWNKRAANLTR